MYKIPAGKFPLFLDSVLIMGMLVAFFLVERKLVGTAGLPPFARWGAVAVAGVALLAIPIFAAHDLYALGNMGCEVRPKVLVIRWGLYRREIPLKEIESIEKVELRGEYRPVLRTFGIGEPGYKVGWFKLAGGGRALLFVGRKKEVVCIRAGRLSLLLGVEDPERFLEDIQRR